MKHLLLTTIAAVVLVGCGESPSVDIWEAVRVGNTEAVKQAIAAGGDVNAEDHQGITPLHYVALTGHKVIAELLISKGADVNAKGTGTHTYGQTPLDAANNTNHPAIADLLRKYGATTGARHSEIDFTKPVLLDYSIVDKQPETVDLLRKHGGKTGEELKAEGK